MFPPREAVSTTALRWKPGTVVALVRGYGWTAAGP